MHKLKSDYIKLTSTNRIFCCAKPVIGLTGGIATGKSSASNFFRSKGIPLIDADQLIHQIYAKPQTIEFISQTIPEVISGGKIDFKELRIHFFNDANLKEKIVHYLFSHLPNEFNQELAKYDDSKFEYFIYDVPLLFERGIQNKIDINLLIYASAATQIERVMKRDGNTEDLAKNILSHQLDIEKKRELSDFVIENTKDFKYLENQLANFITAVTLS